MAILASAMFSAGAMAANNRIVYFGSPDGAGGGYDNNGDLVFGTLTNTPVTAGKRWATEVLIRNDSGSTLNHVKLSGGADADGKPYNSLFKKPSGTSLPSGASFATATVLEGSATCDPSSGASIACNVGTLAANASVKFLVVVTAPSANGAANWWLTGSWNEGWSSTGTNADYNFATGTVDVKESNCGNGQQSWFLGTESVDLNDGATAQCNGQDAGVKSGAVLGGNGGHAAVSIDSSFAVTCPAGLKCFGNTVSASVLSGGSVPGGVEWTLTWFGTKTIKGIVHFGDDYATDSTDFVLIPLTKANTCSDTKLTDCWKSITTSAGNTKPAFVTVVFVTGSNGKGGGW